MSSYDANTPLINKRPTIQGLVITFQLIAWFAVLLRVYARLKLSHSPGWDDIFVVFACISVTFGTGYVCILPHHGLGYHFLTLNQDTWIAYLYYFWSATVSYMASTTLIKISILVQYLRLFKTHKPMYRLCLGLLAVVGVWGIVFMACLLFSCSPVDKFWRTTKAGQCFGFGVGTTNPDEFYYTFAAHSASNMALDIVVLTLPAFALSHVNIEGRRKFAIVGLLGLGAIVVTISIVRLATIAYTRAGQFPTTDPTYLSPAAIVLSCLETDIAILCASIPIFWPVLSVLSLGKIFVTNEVIVRAEERRSPGSSSGGSETELRTYHSFGSGAMEVQKHYKDPYVVGAVRPVDGGVDEDWGAGGGTHTAIAKRGTLKG